MALDAKMAVEWIMSTRESWGDVDPNPLLGKAQSVAKNEFCRTAQVMSAMKDPQYSKDIAYTKNKEEKLSHSSVF